MNPCEEPPGGWSTQVYDPHLADAVERFARNVPLHEDWLGIVSFIEQCEPDMRRFYALGFWKALTKRARS